VQSTNKSAPRYSTFVMSNVSSLAIPAGSPVSGTREGRPADGIIKLIFDPKETFDLEAAYKSLQGANKKYNGISNNCTSFVCQGLKSVNVKPEAIYDLYNIPILNFKTEANTPNSTYNQLKNDPKAVIIKDPGEATSESYEDAIIDN
jgi:hypothetical protein